MGTGMGIIVVVVVAAAAAVGVVVVAAVAAVVVVVVVVETPKSHSACLFPAAPGRLSAAFEVLGLVVRSCVEPGSGVCCRIEQMLMI